MKPKLFEKIRCFAGEIKAKKTIASFALMFVAIYLAQAQGMKSNNSWLKNHKRFHIHFTPTSASWLNMVERFFRDLTQKQIRRGCFANVAELIETIETYIAQHNTNPKPFVWTAKASDILEKVKRARTASNKL